MDKASTLIFVGNGFDRALGFKTSYSDFYEDDVFKKLPKDNLFAEHIKGLKSKTDRWSDLEETLSNYSDASLNLVKPGGVVRFKQEYEAIQNALYNYLDSISEDRFVEEERFLPMKTLIQDWIKEDSNYQFYTFNYTLFLERVLRLIYPNETPNVVHLHGRLSAVTKANGLVLGIDKRMKTQSECRFLFKAEQPEYNNFGTETAVQNAIRIIFFGCSMGLSDTWYFDMIFKNKNIKVVEIYDKSQEKMYDFNAKVEHFSNEKLDEYREHTRLKYFDSSDLLFVANQRELFNRAHPEYLKFL